MATELWKILVFNTASCAQMQYSVFKKQPSALGVAVKRVNSKLKCVSQPLNDWCQNIDHHFV